MIRPKSVHCTSTKTALLLFIACFIVFTTLFRHDNGLTVSRWSVDDAPEAGMFMPLTRPGWKTGDPKVDNALHIVGGPLRQPIIDAKGSDSEYPPPKPKGKNEPK